MSQSKHHYAYNRVQTIQDEREQIIVLKDWNLELPSVGVFDEPTRCYKVNKEWAKIITGAVDLLTEIAVWKNAENEGYEGIRQILKFLTGEDCMTCEEIEACLAASPIINEITDDILSNSIDIGANNSDIETLENNLSNFDTNTTTINNIYPLSEQNSTIGGIVPDPPVGEDCNKDAVWSSCVSLVNYIDAQNRDFLQDITQSANVLEQAQRLINATPLIGLLPVDEVVGYVAFLVEELLEEYNAIVDTALLQDTACDLFCIALENDPCGIQYDDLYDYFSSRTPDSLGSGGDTLANLTQFALLGTFSGDDYFYHLSMFQLFIAYVGSEWLGMTGRSQYALQSKAGFNSPDNDWSLFCTGNNCGGWINTFDFTLSAYEWVAFASAGYTNVGGVYTASGWQSVNLSPASATNEVLNIKLVFPFPVSITRIRVEFTATQGAVNIRQVQTISNELTNWLGSLSGSAGANVNDFTGLTIADVDRIQISLHDTDENKLFTVTKVIVEGTGTDPSLGV